MLSSSPVARSADAAVVAHKQGAPVASPVAAEAPVPHPSPAPDAAVEIQMRKAYPDSGVRGVTSLTFNQHESTSMSVSTVTSSGPVLRTSADEPAAGAA